MLDALRPTILRIVYIGAGTLVGGYVAQACWVLSGERQTRVSDVIMSTFVDGCTCNSIGRVSVNVGIISKFHFTAINGIICLYKYAFFTTFVLCNAVAAAATKKCRNKFTLICFVIPILIYAAHTTVICPLYFAPRFRMVRQGRRR